VHNGPLSANPHLPVVVIGAGPIGLAAAAHLVDRGLQPIVLEAGDAVAASLREWRHVRVFTPWELNVDPVAARLLAAAGWQRPDGASHPTAGEIVERYLEPLARLPQIAPRLHLAARVLAVTRSGVDKLKDAGRDEAPFEVLVDGSCGRRRILAAAVIDASGTWHRPNPLGADGLPADGEEELADRIRYRIPDVLGAERQRFAGRRAVVVGSGHSALNVLLDLARLREEEPGTQIAWALRRRDVDALLRPAPREQLPARAALGADAGRLLAEGRVEVHAGFATRRVARDGEQLVVSDGRVELRADEVVAATGFRPDLSPLRELRVDLDDRVEAPRALAPLIDPNVHSCGTVPLHGAEVLAHPERGLFVVGVKSYGRAPTFLLRTGYEQVRSVAAALAGQDATAHSPAAAAEADACCAPSCCDDGRFAPADREQAAVGG
jgi:thioredoxin reductase